MLNPPLIFVHCHEKVWVPCCIPCIISLTKSWLKKETQECKEITKNVFWQFCDNDLTKCNGSSKNKEWKHYET
jgi:hypothetical protein